LKKVVGLICCILMIGCKQEITKQNASNLDSLKVYLEKADSDDFPVEVRKQYADNALKILVGQPNDSLNRVHYLKLANRYFNMNEVSLYRKTTIEALQRSRDAKDTISTAKAYTYLADYYAGKYISDSAFTYYVEAEKLFRKLEDKSKLVVSLLSKATIQLNEKDYVGSEKSAYEAITLLRQVNNIGLHYDAYNLLGIIHSELSEYDASLEYHSKALALTSSSEFEEPEFYKASTLNNLGVVNQNRNNYNKAVSYFETALENKSLKELSPSNYIHITINMAYSKMKLGDYNDIPKVFYDSMRFADSLNIPSAMISSRLCLGEYYVTISDRDRAFKYTSDAYKVAKFHNRGRDVMLGLAALTKIHPVNAGDYAMEYVRISDSLQTSERQVRNKLGRIEYQTEELAIEKDKLIESRKKVIYTALGIILLGGLAYIIRFQAAKNRELRLVQEQQQANEEIYQLMLNQQNKVEEVRQAEKRRIAQELHDGILGKLFGTRMNLGVLNTKLDAQGIAQRNRYIDELKTLEQEIREISHDLNSEKAAVFNNFVLMVANFIDAQRTVCQATISYHIDSNIDWNVVDSMAKINFYRILQEAFQNINKHSNAKTVTVLFEKEQNLIRLKIEDDGVGFVYSKKRNGIGLQNMLSRITSTGGTMSVITNTGDGTNLIFELPVV
jgi:signal transduction histidine kinase